MQSSAKFLAFLLSFFFVVFFLSPFGFQIVSKWVGDDEIRRG